VEHSKSGRRSSGDRFLDLMEAGLERCGVIDGDGLLVAVSGGTDSTALLLGLRKLIGGSGPVSGRDFQIEAAHFNHGLRGDESDADERFCRELCDQTDVRLHVGRGDVAAHMVERSMSREAAARDLRYRFLARTVVKRQLSSVITAHTMDDQAETVLLSATRGAGLRGVSGMTYVTERADLPAGPARNPLRVLRPMLSHRRSDTVNYCASKGVTPRTDESNRDVAFARNRIRHNVLPELERINPGVVEALARLATVAGTDIELIDGFAKRELDEAAEDEHGALTREALVAMSPALLPHVLRGAYERTAGTVANLDMTALLAATYAVLTLPAGSIDLPNGVKLVVDRDSVKFVPADGEPGCPYPESVRVLRLPVPGSVVFDSGGELSARRVSPAPDPGLLTKWQAVVDSVAVDGPLLVRSRVDGDRFQPLGMAVEMKLQNFFVNQRVPSRRRDRVPLVVGGRGICWVAGERVAEWARVPDGAREAVLLEYFAPDVGHQTPKGSGRVLD
jgi:tRNA(Ile)-lysidine synthase